MRIAPGATFALCFAISALAQSPAVRRLDDEIIQGQLDATGYFQAPPGEHELRRPIVLGPGQRLTGCGPATKLKLVGPGDWAVVFGDVNKHNYACYLDNLMITGGGLRCDRIGQHCVIDRVWITRAPGDGVRVEGIGDRMIFRDVVSYGNRGAGFALRVPAVANGLIFDHCNAQANDGVGFLVETLKWNSDCSGLVLRDCTIQGNGLGGSAVAEVLVRGYVNGMRIENVWIENKSVRAGLRTEAKHYSQPQPIVRRPSGLIIAGASQISLIDRAVEFVACHDCDIEQLTLSPPTARVHWKPRGKRAAAPTEGPAPGAPGGTKRMLRPEQLVAEPDLE